MNQTDIVIIGAGAAGLMAAYTLVKAGKTVTVLEARNRIGGRIHTLNNEEFTAPVELGAEFIHGNLPVTLGLLKEAGIGLTRVDFEMWHYNNGKFEQNEEFVEGWDQFLKKLNRLEHDMPLQDFLQQNFAGAEYKKMREQIEDYVGGYDTADISDVSAFALRGEWNNEDEDAQHRVEGGYSVMIQYLADECRAKGSEIHINAIVKEIVWSSGGVKVITAGSAIYEAQKVIVALPLGVLQAPKGTKGTIEFNPRLYKQEEAFKDIGFGSVIKVLLEFDEAFWKKDDITRLAEASLATMGFLFTGEVIPTFWTQAPAQRPLLTGWLGGPPAHDKKDSSPEEILQLALSSLSHVFGINGEFLKKKLVAWNVANWTTEEYTLGSYAYDKVNSPAARKLLSQPVENTIYFAGEYLYEGPAIGTVEAALTSGKLTAEAILRKL